MKHYKVQFNTRARTVKSALEDLRQRSRNSPGFRRLLQLAAHVQLRRGGLLTLKASNRTALRVLEYAVSKVREEGLISVPKKGARLCYLMRKPQTHGGIAWEHVSKGSALHAMHRTTPDTLAVMPVWVYDRKISWRAAAKLDALTQPHPDDLLPEELPEALEDAPEEMRDAGRELNGPHAELLAEDASTYNDAGELETPEERQGRLKREARTAKKDGQSRPETWQDARPPLPLRPAQRRPTPRPARSLPAAPFYYALESKCSPQAQRVLELERRAHRDRRDQLNADALEVAEHAELDALLSPEDLEADMLEPWEALERYATSR